MDMAVLVDAQGDLLDNIESQVYKSNSVIKKKSHLTENCDNGIMRPCDETFRLGYSLIDQFLHYHLGVNCSRSRAARQYCPSKGQKPTEEF